MYCGFKCFIFILTVHQININTVAPKFNELCFAFNVLCLHTKQFALAKLEITETCIHTSLSITATSITANTQYNSHFFVIVFFHYNSHMVKSYKKGRNCELRVKHFCRVFLANRGVNRSNRFFVPRHKGYELILEFQT